VEGLLLLHGEQAVDPEAPWYAGTPDQTQVLYAGLLLLGGQLTPTSSAAIAQAATTSPDLIAVLQRDPQKELQALPDALEPSWK
jgi:hypothetical protein